MRISTRTMRPSDWADIPYFKPSEFKHPEKMGYEFMLWLVKVRQLADVPIHITSSYRSPAYNRLVGGAADSAHTDVPCNAVDIGERPRPSDPNWNYSRWQIIHAAEKLGCRREGMYQNGSLHLDMTHGRRPAPRLWRVVNNPARRLLERARGALPRAKRRGLREREEQGC